MDDIISWSNLFWFLAFGGSGLTAITYYYQDYLLYYPTVQNARKRFIHPSQFELPDPQFLFVTTSDSVKVNIWVFRQPEPNRPTVLCFHGNAGSWFFSV